MLHLGSTFSSIFGVYVFLLFFGFGRKFLLSAAISESFELSAVVRPQTREEKYSLFSELVSKTTIPTDATWMKQVWKSSYVGKNKQKNLREHISRHILLPSWRREKRWCVTTLKIVNAPELEKSKKTWTGLLLQIIDHNKKHDSIAIKT